MGIFKKEESEIEQMEDYEESRDQQVQQDLMSKNYQYTSNMMPEDYYQYRKFSNVPEANAEFAGLVDKDVVFANLSSSELDELGFRAVTIQWTNEIFVQEKDITVQDREGRDVLLKNQLVFDQEFLSILNILKAGYKFRIVGSRSKGDTRAAMLDITSTTQINKNITKKRADDNQSRFGFGR